MAYQTSIIKLRDEIIMESLIILRHSRYEFSSGGQVVEGEMREMLMGVNTRLTYSQSRYTKHDLE